MDRSTMEAAPVDERSKGWLKGCAIGCGGLALVSILGLVVLSVRTLVPLRSASRARAQLEARFGPPESFVPAPDGAIPAERIQRFLDVRRSLDEPCERFRSTQQKMRRVETLEEEEMPSGREVTGTTKGFAEVATGIAPLIGEFFDRRNRALLEAEMGLGEYTYIFAVAYRVQLLDESIHEQLFSEGGPVSPEVQTALRRILSHQLNALIGGEGETERQLLEREIRAMEEDAKRPPWRDGLPHSVESSLAPHRVRLDEAFCPATAGIEMDRDSGRAMIIALY